MGNTYAQKRQECDETNSLKSVELPRVRYTNTGFSSLIASRIQTATDGDYRVFLCGDMNGWNRVVPRDKYNGERRLDATTSKGFTRRESISAWVNKIVAYGHSYDESTDDRTTSTSERSWAFTDRLPNAHRRLNNNHCCNNNSCSSTCNNTSSIESSTSSNASSCIEGHRNRGNVFYSMYNHSNVKNDFAKNNYYFYARENGKTPEADVANMRISDCK